MKKLLIHIGYPKTATTTIQEGLFKRLHADGVIHYLEKFSIRDGVLSQSAGEDVCLSPDKINVLSDEMYTNQRIHLEKRYSMSMNPFDFPGRLAAYFAGKADSIEILATIRNQKDLIYSNYAQSYRYFIHDPDVESFDKYLSYCIENKDSFASYYYHDLMIRYAGFFTKEKLHILLYEDFLSDPMEFIRRLAEILRIEPPVVQKRLEGKHWNKKSKTPRGEIIVSNINPPFVERMMKKIRLNNSAMRRYYKFEDIRGQDNIFNKLMRLLQKKDIIPLPTDEQKAIILKEFMEGNKKLSAAFSLDENKLKKYGYI
ncbi:MAG: sulfotransferase domain-containing protein [Smithella sp.]|nr:sulfotransferase domain-containing protein [Smithella sp.]